MSGITAALCKLSPGDIFLALDICNAFGDVSRAAILEVLLSIPELAPFLLALWGDHGTTVFVANGPASWGSLCLVDGLFQGHNLSSILFCLGPPPSGPGPFWISQGYGGEGVSRK